MKFAENLGSQLTPEWRTQYVDYEQMKVFLYSVIEKTTLSDEINDEILQCHCAKFEDEFFDFCDKELHKVNSFFAEKLAEVIRRFNELEIELAKGGVERLQSTIRISVLLGENENNASSVPLKQQKHSMNRKQLNQMKRVVGEFYLYLVLIQNFQQLNFTAFRKILKKHDKMFKTTSGVEYREAKIEKSHFYTNDKINELIMKTEIIAIDDLEGGDRTKAMKRLRVPPLGEHQKAKPSFLWGLFTGIWLALFAVVVIHVYTTNKTKPFQCKANDIRTINVNKSNSNISNISSEISVYSSSSNNTNFTANNTAFLRQSWEPALRFYRGFLIIFIMMGLLGVNIYGWSQAGVNHVLIFELDPRHHVSSTELLTIASFLGVLCTVSCSYFVLGVHIMPGFYTQPFALGTFLFVFLCNPTKTFWYRSRKWLLKTLLRIVCAPFVPVKFADFWLADQLNSLVLALRDFEYLICFYSYELSNAHLSRDEEGCICSNPRINFMRPVVALLPAWFRFAQCLRRYYDTRKCHPHLVNAGKYFTSIMVTILSTIASITEGSDPTGPVNIAWLVCLLISTIYSLFWDLHMDWGLFAKNAGENKFLRDHLVYEYKAYYYLAIVNNVFLRFLKPLTVSIHNSSITHQHQLFITLLGFCELFRRFVWNFFRLANEHLNNAGEFRAVRDIHITPILFKREPKAEIVRAVQNILVIPIKFKPISNGNADEIEMECSGDS